MGVKSLVSLLESLHVRVHTIDMSKDLPPGTRVAIDVAGPIYKSLIKEPGTDKYMSCILNLLEKLFRLKCQPIFVFDGHAPKEKSAVIIERRRVKGRAKSALCELEEHKRKVFQFMESSSSGGSSMENSLTEDDIQRMDIDMENNLEQELTNHMETLNQQETRLRRRAVGITDVHINNIKNLLNIFGIPYLQLDMEADVVCASLVKAGVVDYCISEDTDLLAYGCPRVIRDFKFSDDKVQVYLFNEILEDLALNHAEFIDLCILMGCDYANRIIGLKSAMAYHFIRKYRSIDNILNSCDAVNEELRNMDPEKFIKIPEEFNYPEARAIYSMILPVHELNIEPAFLRMTQIRDCIVNNALHYKNVFTYCQDTCPGLNNMLITRKINTIINKKPPVVRKLVY